MTTGQAREQYVALNRAQYGEGLNDFSIERYEQAARHVPPDAGAILDVGCNTGVGHTPLRAAAPGARLIGLDVVPERVEEAKAVLDEAHNGLATELPLEDRSLDAITSLEVIEHLTDEDAVKFLAEAARTLRPDGRLIITTPNPAYLKLKLTGRSVLDDPAHRSEFTARALGRLARTHGFDVVRVEGTGRVSRYLGKRFPIGSMYGSYMIVLRRRA